MNRPAPTPPAARDLRHLPREFLEVFLPSLTGMVGFWATLALNIPDLMRFARNQRAQVLGQFLGLPPTMTLFAFIGVAVTSASVVIFGEAIWNPVTLLSKLENPLVVLIALFAVLIATITTNVAANVVGSIGLCWGGLALGRMLFAPA